MTPGCVDGLNKVYVWISSIMQIYVQLRGGKPGSSFRSDNLSGTALPNYGRRRTYLSAGHQIKKSAAS